MKRRSLFLTVVILAALLLTGCQCKHEWSDATCDTPKTCTLCGETEGEALGHDWRKATCDTPKTCTLCGETEGEALGHNWSEATCENPKTCTRCGIEEGKKLAHFLGDPEYSEENYVDGTAHAIRRCTRCGIILHEKKERLPSLHDGGKFLFTPEEFHQRITMLTDELNLPFVISFVYTRDPEGPMGCGIYTPENDPVASVVFADMNSGQMYERNIVRLVIPLYDLEQSGQVFELMALTCDPSIQNYDQLASLCDAVAKTPITQETYEKNGLHYFFGKEGDQLYFLITAEKI